MSNSTTEPIKNLSNNVSVEEIFRTELKKAFNPLLETELDRFLGYGNNPKTAITPAILAMLLQRSFQTKYNELKPSIPTDRLGEFKQRTPPSHAWSDDSLEKIPLSFSLAN